jgi:hypothetical protein
MTLGGDRAHPLAGAAAVAKRVPFFASPRRRPPSFHPTHEHDDQPRTAFVPLPARPPPRAPRCACCSGWCHGTAARAPARRLAALRRHAGQAPHGLHPPAQLERLRRRAQVGRHRLCRKLHRRRLDHAQPHRAAQGVLPTASTSRTWSTALGRPPAVPRAAPDEPQQQGRQPEEHPRPLRPGQRVLRAVAGPDDELFVGLVRGRPGKPMREAQRAKVRRALEHGRREARRPRAGDRLRLGRAGRNGGHRVRRLGHRRHAVDRAAGLRAPACSGPARTPGARPTCGCRTTATSRRALRRDLLDRDGRSRGPRILADLLRRRERGCSSRAAAPACRAS